MDGGVIRWEEPPAPKPKRGATGRVMRPWALVAAQLRERRGEWALIYVGNDPAVSGRVRSGHSWWAPPGAFESTSRRGDDGVIRVWARFVGVED